MARAGSETKAWHFNGVWENYERINHWFRAVFTLADIMKTPALMNLEDELGRMTSAEKEALEDRAVEGRRKYIEYSDTIAGAKGISDGSRQVPQGPAAAARARSSAGWTPRGSVTGPDGQIPRGPGATGHLPLSSSVPHGPLAASPISP